MTIREFFNDWVLLFGYLAVQAVLAVITLAVKWWKL